LWPFHAVHHEAPVLTPFSAARVHPVERVLVTTGQSIVVGVVFAIWYSLGASELSIPSLLGGQVPLILLAGIFGAARHSAVPISFGPFERIFVSPSMHQVHHSPAAQHHNRNFGESLAIWDRVCGSWLRREAGEQLTFGVEGRSGVSFRGAFTTPFAESAQVIRRSLSRRFGRTHVDLEPAG
jgi:sterol desaturase/sphingolipid hydroxylase (fatty acid hydroxylase superfamily)